MPLTQGLSYAQQAPSAGHRVRAILRLKDYFSEVEWGRIENEVILNALAVPNEGERAHTLIELASHATKPCLSVLSDAARTIRGEDDRAAVLQRISLREADLGNLSDALMVASSIDLESRQSELLAELAPLLASPLLHRALVLTQDMQNQDSRAKALVKIAVHLPPHLLRDAVVIAEGITNDRLRTKTIVELLPYLGPSEREVVLRKAVTQAHQIEDPEQFVGVVGALVPLLSPLERELVLDKALELIPSIRNTWRLSSTLVQLSSNLTQSQLHKAINIVRSTSAQGQEQAALADMVKLASNLIPSEREPVLLEVMTKAKTIREDPNCAKTFVELAPHLKPSQVRQAIKLARSIKSDEERCEAIAELACKLAPSEREHILLDLVTASEGIDDESIRAKLLVSLAPYLSPFQLEKAINIAVLLKNSNEKFTALAELA